MGYYEGDGARLIDKIQGNLGSPQIKPTPDAVTGLVDCNWVTNAIWRPERINGRYHYRNPNEDPDGTGSQLPTPYPLLSGVYYVKVIRDEPGGGPEKASGVVFVVTDNAGQSDIVMQTADTSWQAYNYWGNKSLHYDKSVVDGQGAPTLDPETRAFKVSYNRPYDQIPALVIEERSTIWFLEKNGYDVSYTTHVDVDRRYVEQGDAAGAGSLQQHQVYIVGGHDEYWSGEHFKALEQARINGVSMLFMSGNMGYWKTRYENNFTTLVSYKDTQDNQDLDVGSTDYWTGLFRDKRFQNGQPTINPEYDVLQQENAIAGTAFANNFNGDYEQFDVNGALFQIPRHESYRQHIEVPGSMQQARIWRNTELNSAWPEAGERRDALFIPLGQEWDGDREEFRPAGLVRLSQNEFIGTAAGAVPSIAVINSATIGSAIDTPQYGSGSATQNVTMYRGSRNSLIFSAGVSTWSWGLSSVVDYPTELEWYSKEDRAVKQATVNLLADMGVPPPRNALGVLMLEGGLQDVSASTDTTPPQTTAAPATVSGTTWTVKGTMSDVGGFVAGVEVSYDQGATWHRAAFIDDPIYDWQYVVTLAAGVTPFFLSRAVDDSFNMEKVKAQYDAVTDTLYVYGGSTRTTGQWDNEIVVNKGLVNGGTFSVSVTNNGSSLGSFGSTTQPILNVVVQVAIGTNSVTLSDANLASISQLNDIRTAQPTVPGYVTIRGGIGKDTVTLDHVRIGTALTETSPPALTISTGAGTDTVGVKMTVTGHEVNGGGRTRIDALLNGNGSIGSIPVGATVNLENSILYGPLTVDTGAANDQLKIHSVVINGQPEIKTRGGNDRIDRGTAQPSVPNIQGGDGDDTYAYITNGTIPDSIAEQLNRGSDTLDFSASTVSVTVNLARAFRTLRAFVAVPRTTHSPETARTTRCTATAGRTRLTAALGTTRMVMQENLAIGELTRTLVTAAGPTRWISVAHRRVRSSI
jgi:hypothetical protein